MIALGTPNLENMCFLMKDITTLASFDDNALASTHFDT